MYYAEGAPSATTNHRLLSSAASTNATSVAAGTRRCHRVIGLNADAANRVFLKLYDKATAPTVGTDTPFMTIVLPPNTAFNIPVDCLVQNGLAFALTGAGADNDTTAVAAGAILGLNVLYA